MSHGDPLAPTELRPEPQKSSAPSVFDIRPSHPMLHAYSVPGTPLETCDAVVVYGPAEIRNDAHVALQRWIVSRTEVITGLCGFKSEKGDCLLGF